MKLYSTTRVGSRHVLRPFSLKGAIMLVSISTGALILLGMVQISEVVTGTGIVIDTMNPHPVVAAKAGMVQDIVMVRGRRFFLKGHVLGLLNYDPSADPLYQPEWMHEIDVLQKRIHLYRSRMENLEIVISVYRDAKSSVHGHIEAQIKSILASHADHVTILAQERQRHAEATQLLKKGYSNRDRVDLHAHNIRALMLEVLEMEGVRSDLERRLIRDELDLMERRAELEDRLMELQYQIDIDAMEVDRIRKANLHTIKMPADGYVESVEVVKGQVVQRGEALFYLTMHNSDYVFVASFPSRDIGNVQEGSEAIIEVKAYRKTKFGTLKARVDKIDEVPLSGQPVLRQLNSEIRYTVTLVVDQQELREYLKASTLKAGMDIEVLIKKEKVSILGMLTEPLFRIFHRFED